MHWDRVREQRRSEVFSVAVRFSTFTARDIWQAMDLPFKYTHRAGGGFSFSSVQGDLDAFVAQGLVFHVFHGKPGVPRVYGWVGE